MSKRAGGRVARLLDHPWSLVVGGAVLGAVATELTPLKLITMYVGPVIVSVSTALAYVVSIPLWTLPVMAVGSALIPWGVAVLWRRTMRSRQRIAIEGIMFQAGYRTVVEVWPVCQSCRGRLLAKVQPKERLDRNNVPFLYRPDEPNVLMCDTCGAVTELERPLSQLVGTVRERMGDRLVLRESSDVE